MVNVVKKAVKKVKEGTKEFYASFDIDAVDAAFAPGTQSPVQEAQGAGYRAAGMTAAVGSGIRPCSSSMPTMFSAISS